MELVVNQIICGDCVDILKDFPDNSIDMVITSPPYGTIREYHGYIFNVRDIIQELYRVLKESRVVVWVVGDQTVNGTESCESFVQALLFKKYGFNLHDTMIYHKNNPPPVGGNNRYYQSFEYMFVFSKGSPMLNPIMEPRRNKYNDKRISRLRPVTRNEKGVFTPKEMIVKGDEVKLQNVWSYIVSGGASATDKIAYKHPAIFPEKLAEDHIISWSNEGDVVLDPMCGSGTVCKMAKMLNRKYIGIDVSEEYCEIARKRISDVG